ncbi:MAG: hypothetical protein ACOCX4_03295 [Planctomycetota bacterium]
MRTWTKRLTAMVLAGAMVLGGALAAEETAPAGGGKGGGPGKEIREAAQAHHQEQRAEWKALREQLKDMEASEAVQAIKNLCETNYSENQAFSEEQHQKRVGLVTELLTEKGVDAEKQAEVLGRLETAYAEHKAHRATQHEENVAVLDTLAGKEGLTKKEVRSTLGEHRKQQSEENKAFREARQAQRQQHRQNRGGGQGQGRGSRGGGNRGGGGAE